MTLYIIPAYEETLRNQGYRHIVPEARKRKYKVKVLNLQIKGRLLSDLVKNGVSIIGKDKEAVLFGFSTGALIAFCISKEIKIKKGIFCSISPILGADVALDIKLHEKYFTKKTVQELKSLKYGKSLAQNKVFMCGDKEGKKILNRMKKIHKNNGGKFVLIKNNDHELNRDYTDEIVKYL